MKTRLEVGDVDLLKGCLSNAAFSDDHQCAFAEILTKAASGVQFDVETGNRIVDVCRDAAVSVETLELNLACQLMELALAIRPSGSMLQKKVREYARIVGISEAGVTECNGVELEFGRKPPVPLLRALANGSYEQHEAKLLVQFITSDDRVLELGAGIGYMGTLAMSRCNPLSYTAYEANPALLPFIYRNMERNGVRFEPRNALLANEEGMRDFYVTPAFWASSLIPPDAEPYETVTVPAVDKNVVMEELKPTVLVVDIEGGEAEFFDGLNLGSVTKIMMEIHPAVLDDATLSGLYRLLLNEEFRLNIKASSKVVLYWYR